MKNIGNLALVGTNGSGKSQICAILVKLGFQVISLSDIVRLEIESRGLIKDRDTLVSVANDMKKKHGTSILAERAVELISSEKVVFDSVRHIDEVMFLKKKSVFILGVDAPVEMRYERIYKRGRDTDRVSYKEFLLHDERENDGNSFGQNIYQCLELCDRIITNEGRLVELESKLDSLLIGS